MNETFSAAQIFAIFCAIRRTNFSDSITHGPRINAGSRPPTVTFRMRSGLAFTSVHSNGSQTVTPAYGYTSLAGERTRPRVPCAKSVIASDSRRDPEALP